MTIKPSIVSFLLCILTTFQGCTPGKTQASASGIYDITKYGAKTGGADITKALTTAWTEAVASNTSATVLIPKGTWYLSQVLLVGHNSAPIVLRNEGTVEANADPSIMSEKGSDWIKINYANDFTLTGGGTFDGKGHVAWKKNDCHKTLKCAKLPYNFSFNFLKNSVITDVTTKDSKHFHLNLIGSHNVTFLRFNISTPNHTIAPNTDGIHMGHCTNIRILDSTIATGDDCVSVGDNTTNLIVKNVTCGPGNGISVGSLGRYNGEKDVTGIYVKNCTFTRTANGVRIKSWPSSKIEMVASDMIFENLIMKNVTNPIIVDQEYCPHGLCDKSNPSSVKITNVTFNNIKGTTSYPEVVTLICSKKHPCDIKLGDIDLEFVGTYGNVSTTCINIKPTFIGKQKPPLCSGTGAATTAKIAATSKFSEEVHQEL